MQCSYCKKSNMVAAAILIVRAIDGSLLRKTGRARHCWGTRVLAVSQSVAIGRIVRVRCGVALVEWSTRSLCVVQLAEIEGVAVDPRSMDRAVVAEIMIGECVCERKPMRARSRAHAHAHRHAHMHALCTCAHEHAHTPTHTHRKTWAHTHTHTRARRHTLTHAHAHTRTHTHTHTRAHTCAV